MARKQQFLIVILAITYRFCSDCRNRRVYKYTNLSSYAAEMLNQRCILRLATRDTCIIYLLKKWPYVHCAFKEEQKNIHNEVDIFYFKRL